MSRRSWVVNASPLIFLGKIGALPLLEQLADEIVMPFSVHREILAKTKSPSSAPPVVLPDWLIRQDDLPLPSEIAGWDLGAGESQVLAYIRDRLSCPFEPRALGK